VTDNGP